MVTKDQIIEDIILVNKQIKSISKRKYEKYGIHSCVTIRKLFGSWSNALYEALKIRFTHKPKVNKACLNCGEPTKNNKFCSSSCFSTYYNKNENGRKTGRKRKQKLSACHICGGLCEGRKKRCKNCKFKIKTSKNEYVSIENLTKQQVLTNDTQKYRRIRTHARSIAEEHNLLHQCIQCNYNRHVECCHKKPIKSFPPDALIKEINDPKNLMGLCPNHHWEFDHPSHIERA